MTQEQAHKLVEFLKNSFLVVEQGLSLEEAADVYDDMNGDSEYTTALGLVVEETA